MTKLIDLSLIIEDGMPNHPEDTGVKIIQDKFLKTDKYVNHVLKAGMHTGTHIDTAMHGIESNVYISDISINQFVGRGYIIDAKDEQVIVFKEKYEKEINTGDIVLIYTNHIKKYGQSCYYNNYPTIDKDLAQLLVRKNVKMVGVDCPSVDYPPYDIHKIFFENNISIIENLCNLDQLLEEEIIEIMALPLKIKAEASLARVVAQIK